MMTTREYLDRERAAPRKSEYHRGNTLAMPDVSAAHVLIVTNLAVELSNRLDSRDCEVYSSNLRLLVSEASFYTYPDVMVVCGKPALTDEHNDVLTNPVLIVEVLSEGTADYDWAEKFHRYRQIPSFLEYLTVSQTEKLVDHWVRQPDDSWLLRQIRSDAGIVPLLSLGVDLKLSQIYKRVEFPGQTEAEASAH